MADNNELIHRLRQMELERDAEAAKARHAQAVLQTLRALSTLRTAPAHACANRTIPCSLRAVAHELVAAKSIVTDGLPPLLRTSVGSGAQGAENK
jgi:hypothetical protein